MDDTMNSIAVGALAVQTSRLGFASELLTSILESAEKAATRGFLRDPYFGLSRPADARENHE